jgi:NADH-quinone oxidoreductase subunit J
MTFSDGIFWFFAAMAVGPALALLFTRSIVRMAFLLLFSLAGFAGLYLQLGAGFVGFTQVLVYIGGILILFLFGVMLTARIDVPARPSPSLHSIVPGVLAGLVVMGCLLFSAVGNPWAIRQATEQEQVAAAAPDSPRIGLKLLSSYVLPFEAVSILLLAAMVGATYIARSRPFARKSGAADGGGGNSDEPGADSDNLETTGLSLEGKE